jgi:hypothetical protein
VPQRTRLSARDETPNEPQQLSVERHQPLRSGPAEAENDDKETQQL